jgi:beta-glucosidase
VKLRARWLKASVSAIKHLRSDGIPIHGYTWFPLFTMVDWRYRFGHRPLKDYQLDLGLYQLAKEDHRQRWKPTSLVEQFQNYVIDPVESIGPLASA